MAWESSSRGEGSPSAPARGGNEPQPSIFLSHSGRQKDFVTDLYLELLRVRHYPFFDMDTKHSLTPGRDYALEIFRACHGCKMAVVVLSHDYIKSLWPMLELQEFFLHNPECRIYPLFLELKPSDLSNNDNMKSWKQHWSERKDGWQQRVLQLQDFMGQLRGLQITLDMDKWEENLLKLQYRSGNVRGVIDMNHERVLYQSRNEYIKAIVSNICSVLPSPQSHSLGEEIKGTESMIHQVVLHLFERQQHGNKNIGIDHEHPSVVSAAVGVYGIGGSGKSTLCMSLADFFCNEFHGRSWRLEFPSKDTESGHLMTQIKAILPSLSSSWEVSTLEQATAALQHALQRNKVFLALDNVWDIHVNVARNIVLKLLCMPGSKVLVTSRSKEILKRVLHSNNNILHDDEFIVHVPSMSEDDAVEALISYSCLPVPMLPPRHQLARLARSCFIGEHCYPLFVKLKGVALREQGRKWRNDEDWDRLISRLEVGSHSTGIFCTEDSNSTEDDIVMPILEKSLDNLKSDKLKKIFSDLVTCGWTGEDTRSDRDCEWLAMLYGTTVDDVMQHMVKLEYDGLLEIENCLQKKTIRIHDLYKRVGQRIAHARGPDALFRRVFQGSLSSDDETCCTQQLAKYEYILAECPNGLDRVRWRELLKCCRRLQVLWLYSNSQHMQKLGVHTASYSYEEPAAFNLMQWLRFGSQLPMTLRILRLERIADLEELWGWEGAPNLESLHLEELTSLKTVGDIGCLKKLESLHVSQCKLLQVEALVHNDSEKRAADHVYQYLLMAAHDYLRPAVRRWLVKAGDELPNLRILKFVDNGDQLTLVELGPMCDAFPALQTLHLCDCSGLSSFPAASGQLIQQGSSLRTLDLSGCRNLERIRESIGSLTALEELDLSCCRKLESIPDLTSQLPRLRILLQAAFGTTPYWKEVTRLQHKHSNLRVAALISKAAFAFLDAMEK